MKNPYLIVILKITCGLLALFAILTVAIYKTQLTVINQDKVYPALLGVSIVFLHWLSWRFYFEVIGLPESERINIQKNKTWRRSSWNLAIGFGYFFLTMSMLNHYISPEYAHAQTGIEYTIILLSGGIVGQMAYITRHLITKKYKENGA